MEDLSDELLDGLSVPLRTLPPPQPPKATERKPTPAVVTRAKEIVQEIKGGKAFSEHKTEVDKATKIAFLAHVLEGEPFLQTYELMGGKLKVTFQDIPASWESALLAHVGKVASDADKGVIYHRYLALISLVAFERPELPLYTHPLTDYSPGDLPKIIQLLESRLSRSEMLLLEAQCRTFRSVLTTLLSEANNPSFWNPLS